MENFADYGIEIRASSGQVKTRCPKCSAERSKKRDACLSVDVDRGVWNCHHCGWKGRLKMEDHEEYVAPRRERRPSGQTQPLTPEALRWLESRGIDQQTAERAGLCSCVRYIHSAGGYEPCVWIPFFRGGEVVNAKVRALSGKAFTQEKGGEQCLYGWDECRDADTIVLTEGELDTLAILASGYSGAVASCPNGAPPTTCTDYENKLAFIDGSPLEDAGTVILAMDADEPGVKWAEAIARRVGMEKCQTVTWASECKDANDVLLSHGPGIVQECIQNAKPIPVPGIVELADMRADIMAYYDRGGMKTGYSTGWRTVDEYLRVMPGTLNVLTGIPMSGKSEWLDQLMLQTMAWYGWRWAVYSPENYPVESHVQKWAEKVRKQPMFDCWNRESMTRSEFAETVESLNRGIKLLTFGEEHATLDSLLTRLKACAMRYNIKGAIIDPYNELDHDRPATMTETEYVSHFLSMLRRFARLYDVAIWIVAHPTKLQKYQQGHKLEGEYPVPTPYDISGSANFRNKADSCVAIWRSMKADDGQVQIHVQKVRNKMFGRCGMAQLQWDKPTGVFS